LQEKLAAAGIADDPPADEPDSKAAADMTPEEATEQAAKLKADGTEAFKVQKYKEASDLYQQAIRLLEKHKLPGDAKLLSNAAAAFLADGKAVPASSYGAKAMEVDPDWWKGYWYRAQALTHMLRNKPASTAMTGRCEQAKEAFGKCLKCSTLPANKKEEVEGLHKQAEAALIRMTTGNCGQQ